MGFEVEYDRMGYSVWKRGELLAGREKDGSFYALVQVKERVLGPRGGVREPALAATVSAPTERDLIKGIRSLGFVVPRSFHVT